MKKTCFKCGRRLPVSEFYRHSQMSAGVLGKCKGCTKRDVRLNYRKNREHYLAYDRERQQRPERRKNKLVYQHTHRSAHPEKYAARTALNNAVRGGRVKRLPCEVCGARAEAHHTDYAKPLDVQWLCVKHHKSAHAAHKEVA